jgi:hypothetical protein
VAHKVRKVLQLKILLKEFIYGSADPIRLYCDNKDAVNIAHNLVQHDQTKRIEVDRYFIKEKLCARLICMPEVKGEQLAEILTNGVSSSILHKRLCKLDMRNIFASA